MAKVVAIVGRYKVLKGNRSYIVTNMRGGYHNHAHFSLKRRQTCFTFIKLMQRRQVPDNDYILVSAYRVTTHKQYKTKLYKAMQERGLEVCEQTN